MRLYEIANDLEGPALVNNETCGSYILLPDCQLLNLEWKRLTREEMGKVKYNNKWTCIRVGKDVFKI